MRQNNTIDIDDMTPVSNETNDNDIHSSPPKKQDSRPKCKAGREGGAMRTYKYN